MTSVDRPLSRPAQDIAEFLRAQHLFAELDARELAEIAQQVQLETFSRGAIILSQDDAPAGSVRVVRRGSVDLIDDGRALDRLGPGELFGHPSMLSGLPVGFEVRAAEDTECLRLEAADAVAVLARPSGLRYVARTLLTRPSRAPAAISAAVDPARQRIEQLNSEPAILCEPELPVRVAARRMVERGASCALVRGERGLLGIVTDRDLRSRVLAAERSSDTPVAAVMSSPVVTAPPDGRASDAMLTMLDRGIRHLPIVGARGEILGVLRDVDLLAAQARTPFMLRRAIARAADLDELKRAAAGLNTITIALYDARMSPAQISGAISVIADALTRRLLELRAASSGTVGVPLAWLALGSHGRREAMPSSDLDSGVTWAEQTRAGAVTGAVRDVLTGLAECGFRSDPHGATASNSLFARSTADWNRRIEELLADPGRENELSLLSLLCDARVVTGGEWLADPFEALRAGRRQPGLRRLLLRVGLAPRPPTGFLRDLVVEHSGEHRGHLDIKRGGLLPLVNLARYGSFAAGSRVTGTVDRLAVASQAGTLPGDTSGSLHEAFELLTALRLEHQVEALRAGREPDDFIDPRTLNPLARRYLRGAFRAIASIQRTLGNELSFGGPAA